MAERAHSDEERLPGGMEPGLGGTPANRLSGFEPELGGRRRIKANPRLLVMLLGGSDERDYATQHILDRGLGRRGNGCVGLQMRSDSAD